MIIRRYGNPCITIVILGRLDKRLAYYFPRLVNIEKITSRILENICIPIGYNLRKSSISILFFTKLQKNIHRTIHCFTKKNINDLHRQLIL